MIADGIYDPHDAILGLLWLGDSSLVPPLIQALSRMGRVPTQGPYGAIDTRFHCLEALQIITNHDPGRNADDWQAWWNANKQKPRTQWIIEGFTGPRDTQNPEIARREEPFGYNPSHSDQPIWPSPLEFASVLTRS